MKDNIGFKDDTKFKYEDWIEENEYRVLYNGSDDFFDIVGCIKRIYLGTEFRHENVIKLCEIMSQKRHKDITPDTFTRITIHNKGGILYNVIHDGGGIVSDMLEILYDISKSYYKELTGSDEKMNSRFYDKLEKEKKSDEKERKENADHWKDKYYSTIEENSKLLKEKDQLWKEKDQLRTINEELRLKLESLKKGAESREEGKRQPTRSNL
jgi:hypothetical protein